MRVKSTFHISRQKMKHLIHAVVALVLILPVSAGAREASKCNVVTKVCVMVPFTPEEEAAADAAEALAAQQASAPVPLSPMDRLLGVLAERFGVTVEQLKAEMASQ